MVDTAKGAFYIFLSGLCFGLVGVLVKFLVAELNDAVVVFFRNFFAVFLVLPFLKGARPLHTGHFSRHLTRALLGLSSMYLSFYTLGRMRLADAYVLAYTSPLFMPYVAKFWLGEKVPRYTGLVVAFGFLGVMLVVKPGLGLFTPLAFLALGSGLFGAWAQVGIRQLTATEPPARIVFYFAFVSTLVTAIPLSYRWITPTPGLWLGLFSLGAAATAGQLLLTAGYRYAAPGRVGALLYTAVAVAGILDWILWRQMPDALSILGIALIAGTGAAILKLTSRSPAAAPPAAVS